MVNHSCSSNSKFKILPGAQVAIISRETSSSIIQKADTKTCPSNDSSIGTSKLYSIKQGEEITISYHPVYDMPLLLRQKYLQDTYGFLCHCTRCETESQLAICKTSLSQQEIDRPERKLQDTSRFFDLSTLFD
ncbi:hypothetical protein DSO57_1007172 [Entomophthora muscae]|uniref:Uncharacterized protein n=1 Tax=Entomophthora muscae TaxID=34485 RepID=A0ACC2U549_9FUNG|nr:hypothetical protein DSO57_1007172 [Entomophthora muscae]